jgi:SAM-dependent methyltransferase
MDFDALVKGQARKDWWPQLEEAVAKLQGDDLILEAGCGAGPVVYILHQRGLRIKGVDLAENTIQRMRERHPELDLEVGDVANLGMDDGCVGLYISLGVIEHSPEGPDAIVSEASRVTRDDGWLFLTVPYSNVYRRLREPWRRVKHAIRHTVRRLRNKPPQEFYQYTFSVRDLVDHLELHGFDVREIRYCHTRVAIQKDWGDSLLFRLLFRRKGRVRATRINALAWLINLLSVRLMSHTIAITARRIRRDTPARA